MVRVPAKIRIGISGWRYAPWRGVFYPKGLVQKRELEYASRQFSAIEINGSFYALQKPESYRCWHEDTPQDFVFCVKAPRYITHIRRLQDVRGPIANFFASGLFELRGKLGPVLWQFPPSFGFKPASMEAFLRLLPHDTEEALRLARTHEDFMEGRTSLNIDANRPVRHAIEVRNESFLEERFVALLREYRVALVVADTAGHWPYREDITADFVYIRLHGDQELYRSGYSDEALDRWAARIEAWHAGSEPAAARKISPRGPESNKPRDIYCFFDNTDVKLRAPFDARTLIAKLGLAHEKRTLRITPPASADPLVVVGAGGPGAGGGGRLVLVPDDHDHGGHRAERRKGIRHD